MRKGMTFRPQRSIKRRATRLTPNIKLYIFCEGKNTEPEFIEAFKKTHGNNLVEIFTEPAAGAPLTLVTKAREKMKDLRKHARKSNDPIDKLYEVWAVFDRDEHAKIPEAFDMAQANNIFIGYSNPCFELWPYLHLKEHTAPIHRNDLQKKLETELPAYCSKKSKIVTPCVLPANSYEVAKNRAMRLSDMHKKVGKDKENPYTDVYHLFDKIIVNGRISKKLSQ